MFDEVPSSNPPDLPVPAEGAYVWHLEVIVVAVGIDLVSHEYEIGPVVDFDSHKKKWFDKSCVGNKDSQEGDIVLKRDKKNELK